jgi:general secretion pathway protein G
VKNACRLTAKSRVERGFTLVELLVVMAVLSVLAMMLLPLSELAVQRQREQELKRALWEIRDAIDAYHAVATTGGLPADKVASGYPPNLMALVEGVQDAKGERTLRFLRRLPRDPFADGDLAAEKTWAVRSYASPHDHPHAGDDVYDVASKSALVGLNGIPLKEW